MLFRSHSYMRHTIQDSAVLALICDITQSVIVTSLIQREVISNYSSLFSGILNQVNDSEDGISPFVCFDIPHSDQKLIVDLWTENLFGSAAVMSQYQGAQTVFETLHSRNGKFRTIVRRKGKLADFMISGTDLWEDQEWFREFLCDHLSTQYTPELMALPYGDLDNYTIRVCGALAFIYKGTKQLTVYGDELERDEELSDWERMFFTVLETFVLAWELAQSDYSSEKAFLKAKEKAESIRSRRPSSVNLSNSVTFDSPYQGLDDLSKRGIKGQTAPLRIELLSANKDKGVIIFEQNDVMVLNPRVEERRDGTYLNSITSLVLVCSEKGHMRASVIATDKEGNQKKGIAQVCSLWLSQEGSVTVELNVMSGCIQKVEGGIYE